MTCLVHLDVLMHLFSEIQSVLGYFYLYVPVSVLYLVYASRWLNVVTAFGGLLPSARIGQVQEFHKDETLFKLFTLEADLQETLEVRSALH